MNALGIRLTACGLLFLTLFGAGFTCAWQWQSHRYAAQIAVRELSHQSDLASIANAATTQVRSALDRQQESERARDQIDQQATTQKEILHAENEDLRRAVADGTRRLHIAGSCRSGGVDMPHAAAATGLADATAVELASATGQRVLDIRAAIIADQTALSALQRYVREICLK